MKYILYILLLASGSVMGQTSPSFFMMTANPSGSFPQNAIFSFGANSGTVTGTTYCFPASGDFSTADNSFNVTVGGTTWTLTTLHAQWKEFSSATGTNAGATGGDFSGGSLNGIFNHTMMSQTAWNGNIQLIDTVNNIWDTAQGLCIRLAVPAGNYTITLQGTLPFTFFNLTNNTTRFAVRFSSGTLAYSYAFNPNFNPGGSGSSGTYNSWEVGGSGNQFVHSGSFTGAVTDYIYIYFGSGIIGANSVGSQAQMMTDIKVTRNS
jgi:hypothetical protein